ncbi:MULTISPECIES: DUF1007 family protein [Methylobacterium]|uniref:ABC transporter substrate-binding protein n=4 Tax=Pseudomonadota TaxID=1224 RepID=A0ABQ4SUG2_9HYPH|nr:MULTISPECIES: DUF1007 family protein [Methylobacterium]PIU07450.1 MAG: DUF1007 domain-containing protein [Methylobacterium sp. CG09_land_8_20_14_0_10_71_15]PIU13986.1 MAG: DUF1007 domain-containing protein [Methylobacterium sp. CG08_land_8_20_14_0_20_71_15]GBU17314.1 ABC transporter substrate-binding protein [Methylobacterium sp.]GJE05508.1 hypothetical protein AOPFMNJM_0808 [Methylobacterium jeotgali]
MPTLPRHLRLLPTLLAALCAGPALAHPHVWVTAKAEVDYVDGKVVGLRHAWSFDKSYSAFITQGLDRNGDGVLSPEELAGLAAENTTGLAEFGYFTKLKIAGRDQAFAEPVEPRMEMKDGALTLAFRLPLKTAAAPGRGVVALEVYDPTYFVSFALAEGTDAARLEGAPPGCTTTVTRPKTIEPQTAEAGKPGLSEAFFEALTAASNYGVQFANRIIVACP